MIRIKNSNYYEIQNLNGYYINKKGVVYSEKSGKSLKANNGVIEFYVDGSKKKMNVAHLVLETFVGNPQNANRVHYKNGDRNDASLGNVEWKIPNTTKKRTPQTNAATPRQKEISNEVKALLKQVKKLKKEKEALAKTNKLATIVKNNLPSIIEGVVKGENISKLTKGVLGRMLSREELSKHLEKQCGVSLNDIVSIAKLHKTKPNFVEAIVRIQKNSKLKNVVFKNIA